MPTPVSTARQCLTEEAALALDDAVSIAKRRSHPQTSSVHVLSSLLSPSFSLLRDSLSRCRSSDSGVTTRLQFRVLELCINVALDKLYTPKHCHAGSGNSSISAPPPIANSLMAAIKRAQANQRRQPEMYQLVQAQVGNNGPISISGIKVELKHLILSILDDPIVSRVLGDAGYMSHDIKIAIIHPPVRRWGPASVRCPPMFMDFPGFEGEDENCRRIGEVMVKSKGRNPILTGVCANDAVMSFKECLLSGKYGGLPPEIHGVKLVCLEKEMRDFVKRERDGLELQLKEVGLMMESCGNGVVVNLGELRCLVKDECGSSSCCSSSSSDGNEEEDVVSEVVRKLSGLIEVYANGESKKKLWVIGAAANCETYSKFVGRFKAVERDWDLQPLPITSSRSSFDALVTKSSLMGSFVPFGGFFPSQPNYVTPLTIGKQAFSRCHACNEMYERDLSAMLREVSSSSIADMYSKSLSSSLQRSDSDLTKGGGDVVAQTKDVKRALGEQILDLQKKWNEHCRNLHQIPPSPVSRALPPLRPQPPPNPGFQFVSDNNKHGTGSTGSNVSTVIHVVSQNLSPPQHNAMTPGFPRRPSEPSQCCLLMRDHSLSLPLPSVSVTTELDLGTIYSPKTDKLKKPLFQDQGSSISSYGLTSRKEPEKGAQSSSSSSTLGGLDLADYKLLFRKLTEAVAWQGEAMSKISKIITSCRSGIRNQFPLSKRGNIWLTFHGPDKIGKRRAAEALADALFGSRDHLISVDLSSQDTTIKPSSLLHAYHQLGGAASRDFDINMASRMTVVDHIARQLSKGPHSVVFLEDIEEADPMLQNSLSRTLETGKFRDSRGREIGVGGSVVFIAASSLANEEKSLSPRKEFIKFPEEKVLEAQNWQMQVMVKASSRTGDSCSSTRVSLVTSAKRKACDIITSDISNKTPRHSLDLNLPFEETAESFDSDENNSVSDSPGPSWVEGFFGLVDGNVGFKPYNFDALADGFLTKIRAKFEEVFRAEKERVSLEIEDGVMVQILAASWLCAEKRQGAVEEWIERVVGVAFCGARERLRSSDDECGGVVVRLGSCEGVAVNQWASGILLPKSINLSCI